MHAEVSSLLVNRKCKYLRTANTSILRPKRDRVTLAVLFLFFAGVGDENYILAKQEGVLPLGVAFVIITLIVLIAITFSSLGKIPQAVCAFQAKP